MHQRKTCLSLALALALALAATGTLAADAEHDQHHPGTPPQETNTAPSMPGMPMAGMPGGSGKMPMSGMMQMMMGQNGMASHVEGRSLFSRPNSRLPTHSNRCGMLSQT